MSERAFYCVRAILQHADDLYEELLFVCVAISATDAVARITAECLEISEILDANVVRVTDPYLIDHELPPELDANWTPREVFSVMRSTNPAV